MTDIEPICHSSLKALDLSMNNKVNNLDPLSSCIRLQTLDLGWGKDSTDARRLGEASISIV